VAGGPLVLNGRRYEKGLGVHADTTLTYKLDGNFETFMATIGIDDSPGGGSAVFRVRGDERVLHQSDVLFARDSQRVVVDVRGIRELKLECSRGPDLDLGDHGDWAEARLIRAATEPAH
jgi:hypothetical protein